MLGPNPDPLCRSTNDRRAGSCRLDQKPQTPDKLLTDIADYVADHQVDSELAYNTARWCLMDSIGCGLLALRFPACTKLMGPLTPHPTTPPGGVPVPGTNYRLDPVKAAFDIGCMIRWLDYNDTWLAAEWGHPSDNLGALLACSDYRCRYEDTPLVVRDVLTAMIKAYEIQGVLALENAFNQVGLDHVLLVRVASTAVATQLLGGSHQQTVHAVSNAWLDGGALRAYRHKPNTGRRKSWAAGDATSRAVRLAFMARGGEMGYPTALSAKTWGFCDALFGGNQLSVSQPFSTYVMENILFKVSFPAEFHAQTAVEAALKLHPTIRDRLDGIQKIKIETQSAAVRIIDKTGALHNPADRDHCLQYMIAIGLLHGTLTANHYEEETAADPRIDHLRQKMEVVENPAYSRDYLDPDKRSIANSIQIFFDDGTVSDLVSVEYPIGHQRRRDECIPLLKMKFKSNLNPSGKDSQNKMLCSLFEDPQRLDEMPVSNFMNLLQA